MKDAQLGNEEINSILTDRYVPFKPSQEKILEARKKKNIFVPRGEINIMRAMRRGISLRKEEKPETPDPVSSLFGIGNQLPTDLPNVAPTNVAETEETQPSFENITQTANIQPGGGTRTNPSFLGGDPDSILKNLDIARRTG